MIVSYKGVYLVVRVTPFYPPHISFKGYFHFVTVEKSQDELNSASS